MLSRPRPIGILAAAYTAFAVFAGCLSGSGAGNEEEGSGPVDSTDPSGTNPSPGTTDPSASPSPTASPPTGGGGGNQSGGGNQTGGGPKPFEPEDPEGSCGNLGSLEPVLPTQGTAGIVTGWSLLALDVAILADPAFVQAHPDDWSTLLEDLVEDASEHYESQLGLRLIPSIVDRLPDGSLAPGTGDGKQRAVARGYMHANHPDADVDMVAVILGADYEGAVEGMVECVHGAVNPDYSYLWAEYKDNRTTLQFIAVGMFQDLPLKVFMHEAGHLLAAHHHYSNCGEALLYYKTSDALGVCDVMINDIGLASFHFGPTNRLVMRSFVEQIGIGEPVDGQAVAPIPPIEPMGHEH